MRTTYLSAALVGLLALTGCGNRKTQQTTQAPAPTYAPRADSQVYYQRAYQDGDAPPGDLAWGDVYVDNQSYAQPVDSYPTETIGYETMSSGEQVVVVTYVHAYVDPIETYPRVYWAGRWYYNVNGSFVFWDPFWGSWVYYWGPPAPLVVAWNYHYPWVGYCWGNGYYGAGWYWGGVSHHGWHAYGRPPNNWRPSHGPNGDPGGPTGGRPSHDPNGGGGDDDGPSRTGVGSGGGTGTIEAPNTSGAGVLAGGDRDIAAPKPGKPERAGGTTPTTTPTVAAGGTDINAPQKPGRAPLDAKPRLSTATTITPSSPPRAPSATPPTRAIEPSQPPRAPVATRPAPGRSDFATPRQQQPARARVPSVVQVHDASGGTTRPTYAPPTARRAPTATVTRAPATNRAPSNRAPTTVGTNPNPRSPSSSPSRASTPSSSGPTYRTVTPSSPSRSSGSSSSSPSRSSGGSSYSPSRSSGGSSRSSSSPSRSSGGSSRSSSSPSRSSGGGSSSPSRSSGGGGGSRRR